jgi:hypothetical protein
MVGRFVTALSFFTAPALAGREAGVDATPLISLAAQQRAI